MASPVTPQRDRFNYWPGFVTHVDAGASSCSAVGVLVVQFFLSQEVTARQGAGALNAKIGSSRLCRWKNSAKLNLDDQVSQLPRAGIG